jgi:hypothetical protein
VYSATAANGMTCHFNFFLTASHSDTVDDFAESQTVADKHAFPHSVVDTFAMASGARTAASVFDTEANVAETLVFAQLPEIHSGNALTSADVAVTLNQRSFHTGTAHAFVSGDANATAMAHTIIHTFDDAETGTLVTWASVE